MNLLDTYGKNNHLHVIIETPSGNRNKFNYDKKTGLFKLKKLMPVGLIFPCDMGFIPGTLGEDGDPLDALVLMDDSAYPGCLIECRLVGVLKALQKEKGKKRFRNDRFLLVPANIKHYSHIQKIKDLNPQTLDAIVNFFVSYNEYEKKQFEVVGFSNSKTAHRLIKNQKL
ncbi:MAG: inorganic diphosphatase [Bacteroidota bacterium]